MSIIRLRQLENISYVSNVIVIIKYILCGQTDCLRAGASSKISIKLNLIYNLKNKSRF